MRRKEIETIAHSMDYMAEQINLDGVATAQIIPKEI